MNVRKKGQLHARFAARGLVDVVGLPPIGVRVHHLVELVVALRDRVQHLRTVIRDVGRDLGTLHGGPAVDETQPLAQPRLAGKLTRHVGHDEIEVGPEEQHEPSQAAQVVHYLLDGEQVEATAYLCQELPGVGATTAAGAQLPYVERPQQHGAVLPFGEAVLAPVRIQGLPDGPPLRRRELSRHDTYLLALPRQNTSLP